MFMVGAGDPISNNAFLTLRSIRAPTIAILERILIVNIFNNIGRLFNVVKNAARFAVLNTDKVPAQKERLRINKEKTHVQPQYRIRSLSDSEVWLADRGQSGHSLTIAD